MPSVEGKKQSLKKGRKKRRRRLGAPSSGKVSSYLKNAARAPAKNKRAKERRKEGREGGEQKHARSAAREVLREVAGGREARGKKKGAALGSPRIAGSHHGDPHTVLHLPTNVTRRLRVAQLCGWGERTWAGYLKKPTDWSLSPQHAHATTSREEPKCKKGKKNTQHQQLSLSCFSLYILSRLCLVPSVAPDTVHY